MAYDKNLCAPVPPMGWNSYDYYNTMVNEEQVRHNAEYMTKNLLAAVLIQMGYSTIMSVIWLVLESPDLAITEAAVGAGVSSVLFMLTLRRIHTEDLRVENQNLEKEAGNGEAQTEHEESGK